jgi:hypothetical protein
MVITLEEKIIRTKTLGESPSQTLRCFPSPTETLFTVPAMDLQAIQPPANVNGAVNGVRIFKMYLPLDSNID